LDDAHFSAGVLAADTEPAKVTHASIALAVTATPILHFMVSIPLLI
jgi:hypothetical protein